LITFTTFYRQYLAEAHHYQLSLEIAQQDGNLLTLILDESMEGQRDAVQGLPRTQPAVPIRQDFLFVDAAQAKTSRQGRRNARSFVMQKARRERPWSTSKNAAKQGRNSHSTSPRSTGTPDSVVTPQTATPSPPILLDRNDYFYSADHQPHATARQKICPECCIFLCRSGEKFCPRCLLLKPAEDPNNSLFDPFQASSVVINESVSELLEHCKWLNPTPPTTTAF
jgi:hypothetical protein